MRAIPFNHREKVRAAALGHRPGHGGRKYKGWQPMRKVGRHRFAPDVLATPPGHKDRDKK
jgi:hypothetical protein